MLAIIGLGNPGRKFKNTRHNLGFLILDELREKNRFPSWEKNEKANALYSQKTVANKKVGLVKPLTFMNQSGLTAEHVVKKHGLQPSDIVVVHDDLDLLIGEVKISQKKGAGGHNGVQSIIDELGSNNFPRVRIGIKPLEAQIKPEDWRDFVLDSFAKKEEELLEKVLASACYAIKLTIEKGVDKAMAEFN